MKQLIIALQMQLLKKIKRFLKKPALSRLFIITVSFILVYQNIASSPIDSIHEKYSETDNISFFFTKTVTDSVNTPIGKIMGKIMVTDDSITAHINTPDIAQHLKYTADSMYSVIEGGKQIINEKRLSVPPELNVLSMINPLQGMTLCDSVINEGNTIILFPQNKVRYSRMSVFFNNMYRIDSVLLFKGKKKINSTVYSEYREYFPQIIKTTDHLSGIVEIIFHYNIIIDRINL